MNIFNVLFKDAFAFHEFDMFDIDNITMS